DDADMTERRLRQANLIGPAGYISMEDGAAPGFVQRGVATAPDLLSVVEMGGASVASDDNRVTEAAVRGFWKAYRGYMELWGSQSWPNAERGGYRQRRGRAVGLRRRACARPAALKKQPSLFLSASLMRRAGNCARRWSSKRRHPRCCGLSRARWANGASFPGLDVERRAALRGKIWGSLPE